jgi:hypothetical protein
MKYISSILAAIVGGIAIGGMALSLMSASAHAKYPPPLAHPAAIYTTSVHIAKDYWAHRRVHNECNEVKVILVDAIPTLSGDAVGQAVIGKCEMLIKRTWYYYNLTDTTKFCTLVVHEIGHLNHQQHVDDITNIMYPALAFAPHECAHL